VSHASGHRTAVIADLVHGLETYFAEHRACEGLAGDIVEATIDGARWGVACMNCPECGVRWERRLAVDAESCGVRHG
jgi:hypothetical protein